MLALDRSASPGHDVRSLDEIGDLKEAIEGSEALLLLGFGGEVDLDGTGTGPDPHRTRELLDAAADAGVTQVVLLSTAMVYGAWPNNPVPLTEEAPVRPNPELRFAVHHAEEERLADEWAEDHPSSTVCILRPCVTAAEDTQAWMAHSPWPRVGLRPGSDDPPAQFVHLDDLADAVDLAWSARLDGVRNVAPEGWIPPDGLRALVSPAPKVRVPEPAVARVDRMRWRLGMATVPPAVLPYTVHPWVVASDRLRSEGWEPGHSNEEAFVAGHRAGPFATMSPRRRQELSLMAVGGVAAALVATVAVAVRRARRRVRGRSAARRG